jgi:hypothetical protein
MSTNAFPAFTGSGNPRPFLNDFVLWTRNFLDDLVTETYFYEPLRDGLKKAWSEARSIFELVALKTSELSVEKIFDHGLFGFQLKFKSDVINHLLGLFKNSAVVLRKLLEAIDTLLDSIADAIGFGEGAKEIKEFFEHALDDEELLQPSSPPPGSTQPDPTQPAPTQSSSPSPNTGQPSSTQPDPPEPKKTGMKFYVGSRRVR